MGLGPRVKRTVRIVSGAVLTLCVLAAGYLLYPHVRESWWPITFVEVQSERTKLIDGLESYQTIEEARAWFAARGITWRVVADTRLPPGDRRPPHSTFSVSIANYVHLGCVGELNVSFFNNRLSTAWFYPTDYAKYLDRLVQQEGVRFIADGSRPDVREAIVPPYSRVWPYRDYRGRDYVGWVDTRLEREGQIWNMRYS